LKNPYCQLLTVRSVTDIRQTERHTSEPPASEHGACRVETATEKLDSYK